MQAPPVQYVMSTDGARIAYSVVGEGTPHIFLADVIASHVQLEWTVPVFGPLYRHLAADAQFIRIDLRGSGLSDRHYEDLSPAAMASDVDAVVRRLGIDTFRLSAMQDATPAAIHYAATHPDRVERLVLIDGFARGAEFVAQPQTKALAALATNDWVLFTESIGPVVFGFGHEGTRGYADFIRASISPETVAALLRVWPSIDVTDLLEKLTMPTLILHHTDLKFVSVDMARDLTARIPGARLVLLPGIWTDPQANIAERIVEFFEGRASPDRRRSRPASGAVRAILFTDIEGHTQMMQRLGDARGRDVLREHERVTRETLRAHGGDEVKAMGDGFMASFGSVADAAECAVALQRAFESNAQRDERVSVRIGLNAGEPVAEDGDLFGSSVILASRVAAQATGGQILVSDVVRGLLSGKGFLFGDRGDTTLRGFEDPVRLYELRWRDVA